jgi:hypothetical protein
MNRAAREFAFGSRSASCVSSTAPISDRDPVPVWGQGQIKRNREPDVHDDRRDITGGVVSISSTAHPPATGTVTSSFHTR